MQVIGRVSGVGARRIKVTQAAGVVEALDDPATGGQAQAVDAGGVLPDLPEGGCSQAGIAARELSGMRGRLRPWVGDRRKVSREDMMNSPAGEDAWGSVSL